MLKLTLKLCPTFRIARHRHCHNTMSTEEHRARVQSERYGAGDTYLVLDVLPPEIAEAAMDRLRKEVKWNTMMHRGEFAIRVIHADN